MIEDNDRVGNAVRCQLSTLRPDRSMSVRGKWITPAKQYDARSRVRFRPYICGERRSHFV